jgi:Holliday junction resolvasome RuvABC ATP-dependent DNA helicase subunit
MNTQELFPHLIGQKSAKRRLGFYLKNYKASKIMPHLMFVAPKGCGKTTLAEATADVMMSSEDPTKAKRRLTINCSTIKNIKQFFNQIIIPHVADKEVTVILDEASELPKDVEMALLTILNPNKHNVNTFSYEDYTVEFNFRFQSFMLATTEAQSIFHALMDRCERVDLEEYSFEELGKIVGIIATEVEFEDGLLDIIAPVLRGNARQAQKMATHINSYLRSEDRSYFTEKDWNILRYNLGTLPLGLSSIELQILRLLAERKESSLTYLAAKTGLTKSCIQRDFEMYLQKHNLMEIGRAGRSVTKKGHDYLTDLEAYLESEGKIDTAPKKKIVIQNKKPVRIKLPDSKVIATN